MRIEDIDRPRVVQGAADALLYDHEWLGLDWDEGPFFQSCRDAEYEEAIARLRDKGLVYPCTCSRKEIASVASAPHGELGPRYPGTCRAGPARPERPAALRFRFDDPSPGFSDLLQGRWPAGTGGGDFVVRRADRIWAYQLAVVVDDAGMGITEVIRGDDLLSSTPRQLALFAALDRSPPAFAHLGLVVDEAGTRLSKRHHAAALRALREAGHSAEAIVGLLARSLGLQHEPTPIRAADLICGFEFSRVSVGSCRLPSSNGADG